MNIHVTTKTQEVAVEILDTDVLYKYILPLGGIQATSIVQSALVGKHHRLLRFTSQQIDVAHLFWSTCSK